MGSPFSLSGTIVLKQKDYQITSEYYLLNHIESNLEWLEMSVSKIDERQIMFRKADVLNAFRTKDYLRNLTVKVDIRSSEIYVELRTETIFIFLYGTIVLLLGIFSPFPLIGGIIGASLLWSIGFVVKALALSQVKQNLYSFLIALKS